VRHVRSDFDADGNGPFCHFLAALSLIPAAVAAASNVFPSIRFFLSKRTCLSVTIEALPRAPAPIRNPHGSTVAQAVRTVVGPAILVVVRRHK